ncbi:uncharacterized protein LOC131244147 [Magnolia sinica]|uniref:uncharacterized protein LOC131244147 n=1 Tax=Magnolia sinica TaxID=86752 RepID=UPI00265880B8|nr:uncharacterized protein LOC131244147 [Magnolia sinica]
MEVLYKQILKWPSKIKSDADKQDKRKCCHFHHDHGHSTDDCFDLKEEIEALIRNGHLQEYVNRREDRMDPKDDRPINNEPTREILTTFGGPARGGDLNRSRRAHSQGISHYNSEHQINAIEGQKVAHGRLTFTEEDAKGIHHPYDNALVVTMMTANCKVFQILVYTSNLTDILFAQAFNKMGVERD